MTAQQPEYIITEHDIDDIAKLVSWCRNVDKIRSRLSTRPHPQEPDKPRPPCEECIYQSQAAEASRTATQERYIGVCAVQDKCMDYSDFIESIEDELSEDDDPVCSIKCAKRVNPQQEALAAAYEKGMRESSSPEHHRR